MQEKSEFDLVATNPLTYLSFSVFLYIHMYIKYRNLEPLYFLFFLLSDVFACDSIFVNYTVSAQFIETMIAENCKH